MAPSEFKLAPELQVKMPLSRFLQDPRAASEGGGRDASVSLRKVGLVPRAVSPRSPTPEPPRSRGLGDSGPNVARPEPSAQGPEG
eukprot:5977144-Pyramimonas_sp.AAC.1